MADNVSEEQIRRIVQEVVSRVVAGSPAKFSEGGSGKGGVFQTVDEAVVAATSAQRALVAGTLEERRKIIEAIRQVIRSKAEESSRMTVE